jgi:hypothetical protein
MGRGIVSSTILIATVLWIGGASAQTLDIDRMSKEDVNKLTPEQMNALPAFKVFNKLEPQMAAGMRAWVPMMLRDLGYGFREAFNGTDEQLQRWVTQFQHDVGEPETGALTLAQMDTLTKRSDALKIADVNVSLPALTDKDGPEIIVIEDLVSAKGTFIIEGDKPAYPLNIASFECDRKLGYCNQSNVDINDDGSIYYVNTFQTSPPILSWNDEEVVANGEGLCATTTLTINIKAKEVYAITRNNGNQSCAPLMTPLAKPQISKLVSGFNVSQDYFAKKRKEADGYRTKEYQEYLEAMRGSLAESGKAPLQSKAKTNSVPPQQ